MRLVHKLALVLMAAAALPLGTAGFWLVATNQHALEAEVKARFDQTARHAADAVANDVEGRARMLPQLAQLIDFGRLSHDELDGALQILKRQAHAAAAHFSTKAEGGIEARALHEGLGAVVFAPPEKNDGRPLVRVALAVRGGLIVLSLDISEAARRLEEVRGTDGPPLWLLDDRGQSIEATAAASPPAVRRRCRRRRRQGWSRAPLSRRRLD